MEDLADDCDLVGIELRLHPKVNPVCAHAKEKLTRCGTARTHADLTRAQSAIEEQLGGRQGEALRPTRTMNRYGGFHLANRPFRRCQRGFLTCHLVDVLPKIQRLGALLAAGVEMTLHRCLFPRSYDAPCEINPVLHRVVIHLSPLRIVRAGVSPGASSQRRPSLGIQAIRVAMGSKNIDRFDDSPNLERGL